MPSCPSSSIFHLKYLFLRNCLITFLAPLAERQRIFLMPICPSSVHLSVCASVKSEGEGSISEMLQ